VLEYRVERAEQPVDGDRRRWRTQYPRRYRDEGKSQNAFDRMLAKRRRRIHRCVDVMNEMHAP
jgi:hypothetical protein